MRFNQAGSGSRPSEVEGADGGRSQRCSRLERSFGCEGQVVKVLQVVKDWLSAVTLSAMHLSHEQRFYGRNRPTVLYLLPLFCVFQSSTTRPCPLLLKDARKLLLFLKMLNAGRV